MMVASVFSALAEGSTQNLIVSFDLDTPDSVARLLSLVHGKKIETSEFTDSGAWRLVLEGGLMVYVNEKP